METIGATDITKRLAELLERTAHGETFEITHNGRAVAKLVPAEKIPDPPAAAAAVERLKAMRGTLPGMKAADVRQMAHEGHKY